MELVTRTVSEVVTVNPNLNLLPHSALDTKAIHLAKTSTTKICKEFPQVTTRQPFDLSLRATWKTNNSNNKQILATLLMQLELFQTKISLDSLSRPITSMIVRTLTSSAVKVMACAQEMTNLLMVTYHLRIIALDQLYPVNLDLVRKSWRLTPMG